MEPEETVTEEIVIEKPIDYSEQINSIEKQLQELKELYEGYLLEQEEKQPTTEEIEQQQQKEIEQEESLQQFREDLLKSNEELLNSNLELKQVIEISPDYSNAYEEQQKALENMFDGFNVLIGLVLGVGVAIAFIKGFSH